MRDDDRRQSTDAGSTRQPVRTKTNVTVTSGIALVSLVFDNDTGADLRIRITNDLDGPVLPPRQEGIPAAGWDGGRFTGVVPADGRLGVGYACPIPGAGTGPVDADPASVELLGPADGDDAPASDVAGVVRSLGRAAPPADAVPAKSTTGGDGAATRDARGRPAGTDPDVPRSVTAWLETIERRVRRAEQLTDATADEAAAVLEDPGGIDGVADLPDELRSDVDTLRAVGDRIDDLAASATAADPEPVVSALVAAADDAAKPGNEPTDPRSEPCDPNGGTAASSGEGE